MSSVLRLPFDQYQRYRLVSDLLSRMRTGGGPLKVLDVGGRTALLREFLPDDEVVLVDLEPSEIRKGLVLGSGSELPFQAESFDVVCAFDTLEHVPPDQREAFVRECWRVTRSYTILAGPYDAPKVRRAENLLRRFMREKLSVKHRYLEEHREHGLPVQLEVEQQVAALGGQSCSIGHANVERWLGIMSMGMYLDNDPGLRRMAASVYEFYNKNLYKSDHAEPTYRQAIVAAYNGAPLPVLDDLFDPPVPPRGAVEGLNELLSSMVGFDQERALWREEKSKYESSVDTLAKDLEGHRQSLGEFGADNQARKETTKTLKSDLAEHRRVMRELKKENNALQREMSRREKLRTGELKELAKVRKQLEGTHASATYQAEVADTEKSMRGALEGDLKEHRKVLESLKGELAAMTTERDKLTEEFATARRHADALGQQLGVTQQEATETTSALEIDLAQHRKVLGGLESELAAMTTERDKLVAEAGAARRHADEIGQQLGVTQKEAAETVSALEIDLAEHRKVMITAQKEAKSLAALLEERDARLADFAIHAEVLEHELIQYRDQTPKLEASLAEYRTHADLITTELDATQKVVVELKGELDQYRSIGPELEASLTDYKKHSEALGFELASHQDHATKLASELTRVRSEAKESVSTIQADLDGHKKMLNALKNALEARSAEQGKLEKLLASEREQEGLKRVELQSELDSLRHQIESQGGEVQEFSGDETEVVGHRLALEEALREKRGVEDRLGSASAELQAREQRLGGLERDLDRQKKLVGELRRHEVEQGNLIEELSADLDGHRKTVEQMLDELRQARGGAESA